jgi:hypothetical protein
LPTIDSPNQVDAKDVPEEEIDDFRLKIADFGIQVSGFRCQKKEK